ncbi:class I SAM-dependent methyltransferase [Streptomyces sp. NBC_00378]|uniref:class I SAM-dependent methyltransferase n=1 Tax=unclassified Streptomyces TaxID=2593676 RepID=UPI00338F5550
MKTSATARDTWVSYGQNSVDSGPARTFFWDWYQRAGYGAELLGDITNRAVVEAGSGAGKQAAALVRNQASARVTAVDSSPAQHARARELHADLTNLETVHADAAAYLQQRPRRLLRLLLGVRSHRRQHRPGRAAPAADTHPAAASRSATVAGRAVIVSLRRSVPCFMGC